MLEALAERFHSTPAFLQQLNPAAQFAAGEQIQVPNVEPFVAPVEKPETLTGAAERTAASGGHDRPAAHAPAPKQPNTVAERPDVVVTVSKASSALTVQDAIREDDLLRAGHHRQRARSAADRRVEGQRVQFNPTFNYNPELFWDADPAHAKAKLPPGPNNPVGLVWIDLSKEHYGIHGTPEPATIGRTESHGCVRLTNWDALKLAGMVKPGTRVVFSE